MNEYTARIGDDGNVYVMHGGRAVCMMPETRAAGQAYQSALWLAGELNALKTIRLAVCHRCETEPEHREGTS